jgi:hypothetical protein
MIVNPRDGFDLIIDRLQRGNSITQGVKMETDAKKDLREILIALAIFLGLSIAVIMLGLIYFNISQKYPNFGQLIQIGGLIFYGVIFIRWLVRKWQHAHPKL